MVPFQSPTASDMSNDPSTALHVALNNGLSQATSRKEGLFIDAEETHRHKIQLPSFAEAFGRYVTNSVPISSQGTPTWSTVKPDGVTAFPIRGSPTSSESWIPPVVSNAHVTPSQLTQSTTIQNQNWLSVSPQVSHFPVSAYAPAPSNGFAQGTVSPVDTDKHSSLHSASASWTFNGAPANGRAAPYNIPKSNNSEWQKWLSSSSMKSPVAPLVQRPRPSRSPRIVELPLPNGNQTQSSVPNHELQQVFVCSVEDCRKEFPTRNRLERHRVTHNDSKPFPCLFSGCLKRFSRRDNMIQHFRTHIVKASASRRGGPVTFVIDTLDSRLQQNSNIQENRE